jgi:hypothetical protein
MFPSSFVHRRGAEYAERASRPLPLELTVFNPEAQTRREASEVFFLACFFEKEKPGQQLLPAKRESCSYYNLPTSSQGLLP